jgi:hypothetical protein
MVNWLMMKPVTQVMSKHKSDLMRKECPKRSGVVQMH